MPETLVQVTLPEMGESVTEGSIVEWRKKVGEYVAEGEPLVDVTTDKVDVEVPASASGVVTRIEAAEGATVAVGSLLAEIDTSAARAQNGDTPPAGAAAPATPAPSSASHTPRIVTVTLPEMGESVTEGSIVEWLKHAGDYVTEGEPVVSVTTDKVDVEVPATASGVIASILAGEGQSVSVGAPLAEIDAAAPRPTAPAGNGAKPSRPPALPSTPPPASLPPATGEVRASAQARRMAKKFGIDVARVRGSGPDGLILRGDVVKQAPSLPRVSDGKARVEMPPVAASATVTPLKGPAAALAGYMEQSLSIPTATSFRTLAVDVLDARRKELNAAIKAAGRSEKISFTHVIAFALVRAAHELPFITYHFRRDGDRPVRVEPGVHLG
ncbi:MAG TPA: biotin/lipoyl-containing protein, partial [Candidatus Baltobacteraceae bacterium]|nr:biotin/lipoyl-containing protein [Candidatus Baltobacteraceae bacterium]